MKKIILPVLLLSCTMYNAQESREVEEVVIQGKFLNTPYSKIVENIEIITKKEIENSPAKSIDELLQQFSGLDIRRRGANGVQSDISLRGGSYDQVLILINGVQMNDAQTGHNSLNIPVDLQSVERIEVIKGPAARRFGQNAYTGAINIITKTSSEEKVKISVEGGDYKTYALGLVSTFGTEKFQNLFQTSTNASEGYRYNTDYNIKNVFYQGKLLMNNGHLGIQAGFSEKKFGANGFYGRPTAKDQYEEVQASVVGIDYVQKFNRLGINSSLYWRRGQDMYLWIKHRPEVYRNMHIGNNIGGQLNLSYQSSLGTTGIGTELRNEQLTSNNLGERERFISQIFLEHNFSFFNDKLKITPGISWVKFSNFGNYFYPGLDIGYNFNHQHKIYGNIAKVHRTPTYTDLYYKGTEELGNENLTPENALSAEIGYAFQSKDFTFKTSVFGRDSNNTMDWVKNSEAELWQAHNIASTQVKGIEVEVQKSFPQIASTFNVSYTYLDNQRKNNPYKFSKYTAENLRHQFIAKMENRLFGNFYNQLTYRYHQRQASGQSYQLLDEKLSYRNNNFETYILINNLTNTEYTEAFGVPMPKRWFHIGMSYTIK